jgi:hypothetical protein
LRLTAGVLVVAASMAATDASAQILGLSFDSCQTDGEIAADQREPYERAALQFTTAVVKQDMEEAYRLTAPDTRGGATPEQMKAALLPSLAPFVQGLGERHVAHSYLVTTRGSIAKHTVTCSSGAKGSSDAMGDKVVVAVKSESKEAYVILDAEIPNHTVSFIVWLVLDGSEWRVSGVHVTRTKALGRTAADYRTMAQEERQRGHLFNAAILLSGASNLAYRGAFMQLSLWQDIRQEEASAERPPELKGNLPFTWQFEPDTFRVVALGPFVIENRLGLLIHREAPSFAVLALVDQENRRLMSSLLRKRPEIREVFGAIAVQASEARTGKILPTTELLQK